MNAELVATVLITKLTDAPVELVVSNDVTDTFGEADIRSTGGYLITIYPVAIMKFCTARQQDFWQELGDTVRHEVAHVEHMRSLMPTIAQMVAKEQADNRSICEKNGWASPSDETVTRVALIRTMRKQHSHHGPEWKKFARRLGARPAAYAA